MKKASRKKSSKPQVKAKRKPAVSRNKPKAKTVKKKVAAAPKKSHKMTPKKTAKKMPAKKAPAKKAAVKKSAAKKPVPKRGAKENLGKVIQDALDLIKKIKGKGQNSQKNIDQEQKKMFATDDPTEKLLHFFQIEGLKIDSFAKVQTDFESLSDHLNKAYAFANQLGGIIRDDFLNICQDLSKGINLDLMEKDFEKLKKDLK